MKRGLGLVTTLFLLGMPAVAAQSTLLDLFFGSSEQSVLFVRIMYGLLFFVIVYKVSKESIFKGLKRLAVAFSLILTLMVVRFTPEVFITGIRWVFVIFAPVAIVWMSTGLFIRGQEGKFSWARFIATIIVSAILFIVLGVGTDFVGPVSETPVLGGFFEELFSDIIFYGWYALPSFLLFPLILGFLVFLLWGFGRIYSGTGAGAPAEGEEGVVRGPPGFGLLIGGLIIAALIGLGLYLYSSGIGATAIGFFWEYGLLVLGVLLGIFLMGVFVNWASAPRIYIDMILPRYIKYSRWAWWWWPLKILLLPVTIVFLILRFLLSFIIVTDVFRWYFYDRSVRIKNFERINFTFRVYHGRFYWFAKPFANADIEFRLTGSREFECLEKTAKTAPNGTVSTSIKIEGNPRTNARLTVNVQRDDLQIKGESKPFKIWSRLAAGRDSLEWIKGWFRKRRSTEGGTS